MKRRFSSPAGIAVASLMLAVVGSFAAAAPARAAFSEPLATQRATARTLFRPLAATLARGRIPVLVPARMPWHNLHVTSASASRGTYAIVLSFDAHCTEGACVYGGIGAHRGVPRVTGGRPVRLPLGVTAHLVVPSDCRGNCTSTLAFTYCGIAYEIDASDTEANLLTMARTLTSPTQF